MTDMITVRGVVATEVDAGLTNGGHPAANFRLASTERRRDNETQQWVDRSTNWYTVKAFRHLAQNIGSSLRKGDRIVVTGKLQLRQWTGDDGRQRTYPEIIADSVGHDLKWGTAKFARSTESRPGGELDGHPGGAPESGNGDPDNVDLATGEVFDELEPEEDEPGTGGDAPDGFKLAG
jgi:single-strand DNA-binding protein